LKTESSCLQKIPEMEIFADRNGKFGDLPAEFLSVGCYIYLATLQDWTCRCNPFFNAENTCMQVD